MTLGFQPKSVMAAWTQIHILQIAIKNLCEGTTVCFMDCFQPFPCQQTLTDGQCAERPFHPHKVPHPAHNGPMDNGWIIQIFFLLGNYVLMAGLWSEAPPVGGYFKKLRSHLYRCCAVFCMHLHLMYQFFCDLDNVSCSKTQKDSSFPSLIIQIRPAITQLTCMFTALTLALDVVGVIFSPFAVAGVFGTLALTKAVSRALTPGLEAPGLHLVHTGAAALTPRLESFCGSRLTQTSWTGVEAGTRGMVLVLVLVLVEGLDNIVLQHTEALPQAAQRGCRGGFKKQ